MPSASLGTEANSLLAKLAWPAETHRKPPIVRKKSKIEDTGAKSSGWTTVCDSLEDLENSTQPDAEQDLISDPLFGRGVNLERVNETGPNCTEA